jgi:hypothetical protein
MTLPKQQEQPPARFHQVFLYCVVWFWILIVLLAVETYYFDSLANNISRNLGGYDSLIKSIVLRYQNEFTPTEINSTKFDEISPNTATVSVKILDRIVLQLWISLIAIAIIGHIWAIILGLTFPSLYTGTANEKFERWIDSGSEMSKTISGAVTVGLAIVGAVSFVSPQIVGGYIMAGLQILLVCIVLGILAQSYGSDLIREFVPNNEKKVKMDRLYGPIWDGIISVQFVTLLVGIALLVTQVLIFW